MKYAKTPIANLSFFTYTVGMKIAAIITEYNPLHAGHAYQLEEVRRRSGADYIIVLMSGDYVQRGCPAIFDKFLRAEMALLCGADLVLELPCACATASAPRFAQAAVALLQGLGVVDQLWFGSEAGQMEPFLALADLLSQEPACYRHPLQAALRSGHSFPKARMLALTACFSEWRLPFATEDDLKAFLAAPNNILGLAYCQALLQARSSIQPRTMHRIGSGYHSFALSKAYSSATAIRQFLLEQKPEVIQDQVPARVYPLIQRACQANSCLQEDDFSLPLRYQLLRETESSLCQYLDLPRDLAHRILRLQNQYASFSQFSLLLKTRNDTLTHIQRALLHVLLGITPQDAAAACAPAFARILGFRTCPPLLSAIKKEGSLPLVSKPGNLPPGCYERDLFASHLYESLKAWKSQQPFVHEYSRPLPILQP